MSDLSYQLLYGKMCPFLRPFAERHASTAHLLFPHKVVRLPESFARCCKHIFLWRYFLSGWYCPNRDDRWDRRDFSLSKHKSLWLFSDTCCLWSTGTTWHPAPQTVHWNKCAFPLSAVHTRRFHHPVRRSIRCRCIDTRQQPSPDKPDDEWDRNSRNNPKQSRCYHHSSVRAVRTW